MRSLTFIASVYLYLSARMALSLSLSLPSFYVTTPVESSRLGVSLERARRWGSPKEKSSERDLPVSLFMIRCPNDWARALDEESGNVAREI